MLVFGLCWGRWELLWDLFPCYTCNGNEFQATNSGTRSLYFPPRTQVHICLESPFSGNGRNMVSGGLKGFSYFLPLPILGKEFSYLEAWRRREAQFSNSCGLSFKYFVCWSLVDPPQGHQALEARNCLFFPPCDFILSNPCPEMLGIQQDTDASTRARANGRNGSDSATHLYSPVITVSLRLLDTRTLANLT